MEGEINASVDHEVKNLEIFSRNSRITEILELVMNHSMNEKEMESMLKNFRDKYDNFREKKNQVENDEEMESIIKNFQDNFDNFREEDNREEDIEEEIPMENDEEERFCEFDILSMYMLEYVFKRNGPTLTAVSRSLYSYMKCLNLSKENRIDIINGTGKDFINSLRNFTNFRSADGENILIDALISGLLDGNFGLSIFLLKFGLVEIPTEVNEKSRKILEKLVERFNDILYYTFVNEQPEDLPPVEPSALLDLMIRGDVNIRKSLMTFFVVIVIAEFRLREMIEIDFIKEMMQSKFTTKFICLYQFFEETTETKIKIPDIQTFVVNCLSPLLGADFGRSLVQYSRDNLCEIWSTVNPRSLKDLTRAVIRQNLQNKMTFPEQVKKLDIPVDLKEFLVFHCEDIFDLLQSSHSTRSLEETVRLLLVENFLIDFEN